MDVRFGNLYRRERGGRSNLFDAITFLSALRKLSNRAGRGRGTSGLFHRVGDEKQMSFLAEWVPEEATDDLQPAKAAFLGTDMLRARKG